MAELYMKKSKDVSLYGHGFDNYCFDIDKDSFDINMGKVQRDYEEKEIIGNGVYIKDKYTYKKRKIQISVQYYTRNNERNAFNQERLDFLKDWMMTSDDIYLYREYGEDLHRIFVIPVIEGDEKYKNSQMGRNISEDISIELKTKKPLFESVNTKSFTFSKSTIDQTFTIPNNGAMIPIKFKMTFLNGSNNCFVRLYENFGIQILDYIDAGSILEFDTSNMIFKVNDSIRNMKITGTPFGLLSGVNQLKVRSPGSGNIEVLFNERFI